MTTQAIIAAALAAYNTDQDTPLYQIVRQVAWYAEAQGKTEVADTYTAYLAEQKARALQSRYYKYALAIVDAPPQGYLSIPGYREHHEIGSWEVPHA